MDFPDLSSLEWEVLSALSDDHETASGIRSLLDTPIEDSDLVDHITSLAERGLLEVFDADGTPDNLDRRILLRELSVDDEPQLWFAMSPEGAAAFESQARTLGGEAIGWSESWSLSVDFETGRGYIEGTTHDVCLTALRTLPDQKGWEVDFDSLVETAIDGFRPKYYKWIPGGCRLEFRVVARAV